MKYISFLIFFNVLASVSIAQSGCYSNLKNDTLVIGNRLIERKFLWNNGNLITFSVTDKVNKNVWANVDHRPDLFISDKDSATSGKWNIRYVEENPIHSAYLASEVTFSLGATAIKRIYKVYENSPVISCETYLKGTTSNVWLVENGNKADLKNIESTKDFAQKELNPILDRISLAGKHWKIRTVRFFDVTDRNNNLVAEYNTLSYRKNSYKGNLFIARNEENERGLFFLKEAPCSDVQLAYPGSDFVSEFGDFAVVGMGVVPDDLNKDQWVKTYSCALGVYDGSDLDQLTALRMYQKNIRKILSDRDEMVMMNTWGDRSQDSKVNELFCLEEVEKAGKLGISHFQIDDGWQTGKSPNSAVANGSFKNIWNNPDYWTPDKTKYPRGLHPIVGKGKEVGVEICLWFNPSIQDDYADWQKDAQAIISLYKEYGIRTFKIDGLSIPSKRAETNLRKLFDKVLLETKDQVVFNLDATAGRRSGYHFFNEYGNIFLENRYTDWQNYYPYWTLRNLWQLSRYVPAEKIQIEFLNKWRNTAKYGNDVFAPQNYSFEYLFAITMAGQPLAWFEGSGLPAQASGIVNYIEPYRKIQHDFHCGVILPIGDEPSGKSWTGFQSISGDKGYLLIFRENNPVGKITLKTWLPGGVAVRFSLITGSGSDFDCTPDHHGYIEAELTDINSFALYRYETIK